MDADRRLSVFICDLFRGVGGLSSVVAEHVHSSDSVESALRALTSLRGIKDTEGIKDTSVSSASMPTDTPEPSASARFTPLHQIDATASSEIWDFLRMCLRAHDSANYDR